MRCAKCGRLVGTACPSWALPCMCGGVGRVEVQAEREARVDALAERATAAGHTGLEGLVALAKGRPAKDPCSTCPERDRLQDDRGGCLEEHDCGALNAWRDARDENRVCGDPEDTSTPPREWMTAVGLQDGPLGLTTAEERADDANGEHPCAKCDPERHMDCVIGSGMPDCAALHRWLTKVDMAVLVEAVRSDKVVGRGTCSRIDECLEDADLYRELALAGCDTAAKAVKWARDDERFFLEQGMNARWGEDDDPQLENYREFKAAGKNNPVGR